VDSHHPPLEAPPGAPSVSVIVPVLNEERHLRDAVEMILAQDYLGPLEVVLALGPSTDRTDEVAAALTEADPRVRTVPNPSGKTPHALNAAIAASRHEIIARVDGHAEIPDDYLSTAVAELQRVGADNVGGTMQAEGRTPFEPGSTSAGRQARPRRSTSGCSVVPRSNAWAATTSTSPVRRTGR
jgi:succinoglycan biosynthesis protein ExoA